MIAADVNSVTAWITGKSRRAIASETSEPSPGHANDLGGHRAGQQDAVRETEERQHGSAALRRACLQTTGHSDRPWPGPS